MASDASIAQYIADQFAAAGEIRCRGKLICYIPVSYTHLDVYKRQPHSITRQIFSMLSTETYSLRFRRVIILALKPAFSFSLSLIHI